MNLIKLLTSQGFSEEEASEIVSIFKKEEVRKGKNLLEEFNFSKKLFFVERGLLRSYYTKDLKDVTHAFLSENTFYLSLESVFYDQTSPFGLECLEQGILYTVHYNRIEEMLLSYPKLYQFINLVLIDVIKNDSNRFYSLQFQSANDRYNNFVKNHPDLLRRVALGQIASYLGISQQTLSVLRAQR